MGVGCPARPLPQLPTALLDSQRTIPVSSHHILERHHTRVAWTFPSLATGYYWQPVFKEFVKLFKATVIFTDAWSGYVRGCEGKFTVDQRSSHARSPYEQGPRFVWASPSLVPALLRFRPHVVFTSGFHIWTAYLLLFKPFMRWKIILVWDGVSPKLTDSGRRIRLMWRRLIARYFSLCVTNTRQGAEYLIEAVKMKPDRIIQYPYQVPDRLTLCAESSAKAVAGRHPTFLFVGALVYGKGIHKFLEACSLLVRIEVRAFSCTFLGQGPNQQEFQQLADELGLHEHVTWLGPVPYGALGAYYSAHDVLVLPSFGDVWGTIVPEAMLFGKAILCSRHAGAKELVREGENGFVFDPADAHELADYMLRLIWNPEMLTSFGRRSKQIIEPYTPERAAAVFDQTIARALGAAPGATSCANPARTNQ